MGHLFISYSRRDAAFVDRLIEALQQFGFATWKDVESIKGGEVWKASISRAVRECDAFLIVLSPQSANSANVAKELAIGTKHARRVMPVLYQPCTIPDKMEYDLAELQLVSFCDQPFDEALGQLVVALGGRPTEELAHTHAVNALREFIFHTIGIVQQGPSGAGAGQLGGRDSNLMKSPLHPSRRAEPRPDPAPSPAPPPPPPPAPEPLRPASVAFCIHCAARVIPGNAFCTGCGRSIR